MLRIVWFAGTTWLCLSVCSALTCHCLNNATCDLLDGSCTVGCEKGWYGPGCQLGNLAFNKPAFQSSTFDGYTASNAVDGYFPSPNDASARNCSHTMETNNGPLWWYVVLSDSEDFVLKNITVVNIQGTENEKNLRNFYILYTRSMNTPPDPTTWEHCTFQKTYQSTTVATYTCANYTAIGRQVAVYLVSGSTQGSTDKLTLCEVYVDGYAYAATSMFREINTIITPTCGSILINLLNMPIVQPRNLLVQFRDISESKVTDTIRIRNTINGLRSLTVPTLANRTYVVSVAPETCCIGSQCLESFTLDTSKCTTGASTIPVRVTTPQYTQYELRKVGNVISIISLNEHSCAYTNRTVQCRQFSTAYISNATCSSSSSCVLDPRYNYICTLNVLFSDGFNQNSNEIFNISTADFSTVNISTTITCNSVTMVLEPILEKYDLAPSLVEFYLAQEGSNETEVARVVASATYQMRAHFSVRSDNKYKAWAIPVTYTTSDLLPDTVNESCKDSRNCVIGKPTSVTFIATLKRKYALKREGCCAVFSDISPEQCETPESYKINCTSADTLAYDARKNQSGMLCGLKPNTSYSCNHTAYLRSGQIENYSVHLEIVNQSICHISKESLMSQGTPAVIAGSVTGILALLGVATMVIIYLRRRKTLANGSKVANKLKDGQRNSVFKNAYDNSVAIEEAVYGNTCGMGIEEFEEYSQNETRISKGFLELRSNKEHPCAVGLGYTQKNRFRNIVPYDFNRVLITEGTCDYINASYINGFNQGTNYIATQGPNTQTINDFWKMVWQENVKLIIMLTDYVEQAKKKCDRYFPRIAGDTGGISVDIKSESMFDTHCQSILGLCREGQTRAVRHLHFLAWPDKSVPEHSSYLLMFYAKTRELIMSKNISKAPVVVHCSAGVGRTGAFIALDYLLSRYFFEGRVDVDSCVRQLRDQRMHMVQTKEQYMFLHKVLLFGMKTFQFMRNAGDFGQSAAYHAPRFAQVIEQEFQILQANLPRTPNDQVYMAARSEDNLRKNRNINILASENRRPFLGTSTGEIGGYINAVYCNGCYAANSFIATQWPMKNTIPDFWELVFDRNPSCIILLHNSPSHEEYPQFYPQQSQCYAAGNFVITSTNFKMNVFNCANEHELSVALLSRSVIGQDSVRSLRMLECDIFDFDTELPKVMQQTASLIMSLQLTCQQSNDRPIIVVCKDGATFCGLFIAATNSMHRLIETNRVQVFHTVDLLRTSRPEFIHNLVQYECLYQLTSFWTEENALYANMKPPTCQ